MKMARKLKTKEIVELSKLRHERNKAIERLVPIWLSYLGNYRGNATELDQVVDDLTRAHLALTFKYASQWEKLAN